MNCPKCGWSNPDDSAQCANCSAELTPPIVHETPQPPQPPGPVPQVPDYLVWSIVVTAVSTLLGVQCCISLVAAAFGIVAIVKSSQANTRKAFGDYYGALQDANTAKTWMYWAVGVWVGSIALTVIGVVLYFVFIAVMIGHPHGF